MRYESLGDGHQEQANAGWDDLRNVPFRDSENGRATEAEESPLEDSMHFWPPEMLERFGIVPPENTQGGNEDRRGNTRRYEGARRYENARNYEQETDASSRAKVLNFLKWRAMQTSMNDNDPNFRAEMRGIMITDAPEAMSREAEESILYDIRDGVFGVKDEKFLLEHIAPPNMQEGERAVLDSLSDLHERRFLGEFTSAGFDGANRLTENNIREFMAKYPTPVDFINAKQAFIDNISRQNGEQKGAQYREAAESFMNKIYGKRYKYHKQFEELSKEADAMPDAYEKMLEKPPKGTGIAGVAKNALRAIRDFVVRNGQGLSNAEFTQRLRTETLKYRHELENESQDSIVINQERRLYGVFDGAGGVEGGQAASRLASRVTESLAKQYRLGDAGRLADVLTIAGAKIVSAERNGRKIGVTTGALAQVIDKGDGLRYVAYASAGDSRIYVVHADGAAEQLTRDEGYENAIENYLGKGATRVYDDSGFMRHDRVSGRERNVTQYGERSLVRGDRIVICSDGITGDKGTDLMSPEEVGYYVANSKTSQDAAENLLGFARKLDDRSVIVVDAFPPNTSIVDGFLKKFLKK